MIKLKELLTGVVPKLLFHATFNDLVPFIQSGGLIPNGKLFKNFEDIEWGVYLSSDDNFAGNMVQASENPKLPEKWFDEIVILVIDTSGLDPKKFDVDPNVNFSDENVSPKSYIYKGIIPPSAIREIYDYTG